MAGLDLNIGSSVFKRETKSIDTVAETLRQDGWKQTGSLGDRLLYFEKSGVNITAMSVPLGTVIFPSGPVRGRLFGNSGLQINRVSVIGAGADTGSDKDKQGQQASRGAEQLT